MSVTGRRLELSVIVPAYQAARCLPTSLEALSLSDLPRQRWELIVVDDGSRDETSDIARTHADWVMELPHPSRGPSYARNRGAEAARGEWLLFLDADVSVHRDTLRKFVEAFREDPGVAAVFGSYDDSPPPSGPISTYRNLLHHHVHQLNGGEAVTFWAGCGAVRRSVFFEVGMFDEWHFSRPQIEDIELGRRLRSMGHRILLRPEIQATHLKSWKLLEMLVTDFKHRGVPWMRLIVHERTTDGAGLNVRPLERWCAGLTAFGTLCAVGAPLASAWLIVPAGLSLGFVLTVNRSLYALLGRKGGLGTAAVGVPLHLAYYLSNCAAAVVGWLAHALLGPPHPPASAAAFHELGVTTEPRLPTPPSRSSWHYTEERRGGRRKEVR